MMTSKALSTISHMISETIKCAELEPPDGGGLQRLISPPPLSETPHSVTDCQVRDLPFSGGRVKHDVSIDIFTLISSFKPRIVKFSSIV